MVAGVILVHHVDLHLAEAAGEGDLRARRQVLVAEQQQLVLEERGVDRREGRVVDLGDLQIQHLRAEAALERAQRQSRVA